ncbi:hypothetical protein BCR44DRAFT_1002286 [Catenaria anguillulae PL171]|uniref:Uncharacterized protein n=1 Tax=Catenaria anguillulae PL171 TaxID=765915 RepID=A0A1Y2I3E8_9FUNG|nr:hypothetical protein BCR44DRAFT_1002286 [Catenaria anguillulae PL171]
MCSATLFDQCPIPKPDQARKMKLMYSLLSNGRQPYHAQLDFLFPSLLAYALTGWKSITHCCVLNKRLCPTRQAGPFWLEGQRFESPRWRHRFVVGAFSAS